jgi:RNA polymerase sigma factor (sigma-70 family)
MEAIGHTPAGLNAATQTRAERDRPLHGRHALDMALARRAVRHDEAAWREIYERTRLRLFALLVYHTGQREEALELLQETYLSAIGSLSRYDGRGPLEAWFAVIAIRRAHDWKRRLVRRRRRDELLARERGPEPSVAPPAIPDDELRLRLHHALGRLSDRQRAAFLLRELECLSFRAVGQALGCCEATARFHHFRARRRMQRLLQTTPASALAGPHPAAAQGSEQALEAEEGPGPITEVTP